MSAFTNAQTSIGRVELHPLGGDAYRVLKNAEILGDITRDGQRWTTNRTDQHRHRSRTVAVEALIQKHKGLA